MILSDENYHQYKKLYNIPEDFHLFREHYHFGYCPSFRGKDTPQDDYLYVYTTYTDYSDNGKGQTRAYKWQELRKILKDTWRPKSQGACSWFMANVAG